MQRMLKAVALLVLLAPGSAITTVSDALDASTGNPIRKVVSMMEKMAKKIEAEAEKETELYEKFECYCKKSIAELQESIRQATVSPISQADIDAKESQISTLQQEVAALKADRIEEEDTLKSAESQREKEHETYVEETTEEKEVVEGVEEATEAISGGETGTALLQRTKDSAHMPKMLRAVERNLRINPDTKQRVTAFLAGKRSEADDPDYVVGMLNGVKDDTVEEIKVENETEDKAEETFVEVEESKKMSVSTLLNQFERKMKMLGALKVQVVNMKHEMGNQGNSLADDKKMLAELQKSCDEKAKDWDERKAARAEESLALQDTIKMLDSDESLDMFRKRSTSLIQLAVNKEQVRHQALEFVEAAKSHDRPELNFLALALSGKKVDFGKVLKKIDDLIALGGKEQEDDKTKKEYCNKEFRSTEDKSKALAAKVKTLSANVAENEEAVKKLSEDIKALQAGVQALDKSVAEAGDNRKAESEEYQETTASNSAAVDLLAMAKDRLNKVYNPDLVAPTTTQSPYNPYALLQMATSLFQGFSQQREEPQPPPTFEGDYKKKGQESNGVLQMIGTLASDIEKEMAVAKTEEANAQKEYEETIKDAAEKREADLALVAEKANEKSEVEGDLNDDKNQAKGVKEQSAAAAKYLADLHQECDWLLQNYDLRAQARVEEKDNLIRAKTVLSGV